MRRIFGNIFVVLKRDVSLEVVYEVRPISGCFIRVDKLYVYLDGPFLSHYSILHHLLSHYFHIFTPFSHSLTPFILS